MKLNQNKEARSAIKVLIAKNNITLAELSVKMGYSNDNQVSKLLSGHSHLSPEKMVEMLNTINKDYELNIRMFTPYRYRVTIFMKGNPIVITGYEVNLTPKKNETGVC